MASGKNSCQHHILQQPAKIFRISECSDYFGVQNFQCKKKKTVTLTLVKLDTLPFLRIYQFSPGVSRQWSAQSVSQSLVSLIEPAIFIGKIKDGGQLGQNSATNANGIGKVQVRPKR